MTVLRQLVFDPYRNLTGVDNPADKAVQFQILQLVRGLLNPALVLVLTHDFVLNGLTEFFSVHIADGYPVKSSLPSDANGGLVDNLCFVKGDNR